jgi:hypothetical protein
MFRPTSSA